MFNRKRSEQAPAPVPEPENTDIKDVKTWISDVATREFKESGRRSQVNRDNISLLNSRCSDNNNDTRKLWAEKDTEKQAKDQEIAELYRIIRQLKTDLAKKADKPRPAKA